MALTGPIIIVDDDLNDADVIAAAIKDIGVPNEIRIIQGAEDAFNYLLTTEEQPFLILCDIRMPKKDGLVFRNSIMGNEQLRKRSIPFIFYTAIVSQEIVNLAYDMEVQGFYQKASGYEGIRDQMLSIFMYWKQCLHPNKKV